MSRPIEFYGYSDDTVIAERGGEWKDAGAFDRTRVCEITAPDGSAIRVFGAYAPNNEGNGWGFGLVQAGEEDGEPVPEWAQNVRFERNGDPDYSVRMYVYAPEGSTFRWMGEDERMSNRDRILAAISGGEWRSTPEISKETGIKPQTVYRILSSELKWETVEMGPMAWRPEAPHQVRTWRRASERSRTSSA